MLSPQTLTAQASNRVCNALALLQCVASHAETKSKLMSAHIPLYLYPFLNTISKQKPFEYLRLTSLGVIGALVKADDPEVVNFLLSTEMIPLCLRIMETGSELPQTVATFIVQKVLLDDNGLAYMCTTSERFHAVSTVLAGMVAKLVESPSVRLLKHIVRCYLRMSENLRYILHYPSRFISYSVVSRARESLKLCLPEALRDETFFAVLKQDESVLRWLNMLQKSINDGAVPSAASKAGAGLPSLNAVTSY